MDPWSAINADEVKELSWVQCENETCLKWRRIAREEVGKLGEEPWFCHMNADNAHNKCADPEEDHRKTIHTANKYGYRYIFSQLPQGSLVWAKMTGHVSWPAILSPDPADGRYTMINDETGTPSHYHVEFLGHPHSHCWVLSSNVDIYGSSSSSQPQKPKHCKKSLGVSAGCHTAQKVNLYTKNLRESIQEAEPLRALTCEQRLAKCVYITQTGTDTPQKKGFLNSEKHGAEIRTPKKRERPARSQEGNTLTDSNSSAQSAKKSKKTVSFSHQLRVHPFHHDNVSISSSEEDSPAQQVPMLITSKEERLQADIQLLKRAEEKFDRRLQRFCSRHGIPLKNSGPRWQGRQVSRYQVYMAVQERGGYNMVSANRAWAKVYHEACGTSPSGSHQSVSSAVKSFYTRNLLPYELYELRSSGRYADEASTSETQRKKKHPKHESKHLMREKKVEHKHRVATSSTASAAVTQGADYHNISNQPIPVHGKNLPPMGGPGNTCQPVIGGAPVSFEPMDDMGNFYLPIRGQSQAANHHRKEVLESSGQSQIVSQGEQHVEASQDDVTPTDMDLLQEESTQALQELQALENLLAAIQKKEETTTVDLGEGVIKGLDRATHREGQPYASPLSRKKPILLEFYSMQYRDEAECCRVDGPAVMRVNDDTCRVPDIAHPKTAGHTSFTAELPVEGEDRRTLSQDMYDDILLDIDAMGDEIDRLDDELCQELTEI
ncbi:uncharacterized protein LOC110985551 isoform X2 [Acanthaster planci]|uniref:Uncharacterized protein LOC110985551 isoform X2 n=1 Tax=Acanthaster planci TaxID=133434 RepID=A0A8B7ZGG9_ACAPL|nr:uncharacterized protein LOC110985551 isoform X2 [Acanthaster planci]